MSGAIMGKIRSCGEYNDEILGVGAIMPDDIYGMFCRVAEEESIDPSVVRDRMNAASANYNRKHNEGWRRLYETGMV